MEGRAVVRGRHFRKAADRKRLVAQAISCRQRSRCSLRKSDVLIDFALASGCPGGLARQTCSSKSSNVSSSPSSMGRARSVLILALLVIATTRETPVARRLVLASLGDAYIQVSAFVAFLKSASGEAVFKKWGWRR